MTKLLRVALALLLVVSTSPAVEAGGLLGLFGGRVQCAPADCPPIVCCEPACETAVYESTPCDSSGCEDACHSEGCSPCGEAPCGEIVIESDCGCESQAIDTPWHSEGYSAPTEVAFPVPGSGSRSVIEESIIIETPAPIPPGSGTRVERGIEQGSSTKPSSGGSGTRAAAPPVAPPITPAGPAASESLPPAAALPPAPVVADPPIPAATPDPVTAFEPAYADDEPAIEPEENPLFGDATAETESAAASEDSLFGAPADQPANDAADDFFSETADEPASDAEDNLFGDDSETSAAETSANDSLDFGGLSEEDPPADGGGGLFDDLPADDSKEEIDLFDQDDDPFGALRAPGGLQSSEPRLWTDNSGLYRTLGRLASIEGNAVRLVTTDGSSLLVPLARLSGGDLGFVLAQQDLSRIERITRTAMR